MCLATAYSLAFSSTLCLYIVSFKLQAAWSRDTVLILLSKGLDMVLVLSY